VVGQQHDAGIRGLCSGARGMGALGVQHGVRNSVARTVPFRLLRQLHRQTWACPVAFRISG
jgi:hypothetical protein